MELTCVIVDDESQSRDALAGAIEMFCPDVKILAEAEGVAEGIRSIRQHQPDIAFLDIEMADGTGFDIIESLHNNRCTYVLVTAYDNHALKAFDMEVSQYLLKPVDRRKLTRLVDNLLQLKSSMKQEEPARSKISVDTVEGTVFLALDDIEYAVVKDNWLQIRVLNNKDVYTNMSLSAFEETVNRLSFIRIHRSYVVNTENIDIVLKSGTKVRMKGGEIVPVSRANREKLLNFLNM